MTISGKIKLGANGRAVMMVRYGAQYYPLINSNAQAVEAYLHTGDASYLVALATEEELKAYGKTS